MTFPYTTEKHLTEEQLERLVTKLGNSADVKALLLHVASERTRTLEALSNVEPTVSGFPFLQGQAAGLRMIIDLFNPNDDEE